MRLLLLVVIALCMVICEARYSGEQNEEPCLPSDPLMDPIHEVRYGQDTVWQVPRNPKGVLFFAHGHGKDPFSFFDQSPNCEKCYGLPEDRSIALEALQRGFAVIAMKSVNKSFDYVSFDTSQDLVNVIGVINDIRRENLLDSSLPFAAFGSSSGGFFSSILVTKVPARALLLMISEGLTELVENANPKLSTHVFRMYECLRRQGCGHRYRAEEHDYEGYEGYWRLGVRRPGVWFLMKSLQSTEDSMKPVHH